MLTAWPISAEIHAHDKKKRMTMMMMIGPESINNISQHDIKIIKQMDSWESRTGLLACHNDRYLALIPGNQSMNFLGSMVQLQLVSHYLSPYLCKDKVVPFAILPIISSKF